MNKSWASHQARSVGDTTSHQRAELAPVSLRVGDMTSTEHPTTDEVGCCFPCECWPHLWCVVNARLLSERERVPEGDAIQDSITARCEPKISLPRQLHLLLGEIKLEHLQNWTQRPETHGHMHHHTRKLLLVKWTSLILHTLNIGKHASSDHRVSRSRTLRASASFTQFVRRP